MSRLALGALAMMLVPIGLAAQEVRESVVVVLDSEEAALDADVVREARVDVLIVQDDDERILLEDVECLAIEDIHTPDLVSYRIATLQLTPEQAKTLREAGEGTIQLALATEK